MININKPKFDVRDFNGGTLANGIKYVFVNDKSLQKSYVSVCVHAGSFQNPKKYDGLAHFLEHMLFMGSKKYPNENHYSERLNELGGYSNAYTDTMETVYYFNVFDDGLEEIIDIFSRFFIDPLFNADSVNREINAVDSEHNKNINSDSWRNHQFTLNLANADSPINTFICGNSQTLNKKDIREKVINFYNEFYTSNNISICVMSSKNTDELFNILDKTFGQIKANDKLNNKLIISKPSYNNNAGKSFHLKSISNKYNVSYLYEIPTQEKHLLSKDFTVFDSILTEKSESSLYFHLKNLGYLTNISTETKFEGLFIITLRLTKEGYSNMQYCEHALFDKISQILQMDINAIAKYYKQIFDISFDCLNKFDVESLCNMLAVNHFYYNTVNVFNGSFKIFEIKSTSEYVNLFRLYFTNNKLIKIIHSKEFDGGSYHKYQIDQYYKFEFTELKLLFGNEMKLYDNSIDYDTSNDFLNVEPSIVSNIDSFNVPTLIAEKQWYGGCSEFGEPIVIMWMQLNNLKYYSSPKNYILTQISCSVLNFLINVILYKPLQLCNNINFEPAVSLSSININISALNDFSKMQILLEQLSNFIFNIDKHFKKIDERYTNNLIVSFKESYQNIKYLNPYEFANYMIKSNVIKTEYNYNELLEQINTIIYADIESYIKDLLEGSSLTTLTYGNIQVKNVSNLYSQFSKLFFNSPHPFSAVKQINNSLITHPNPNEKSHYISYYYNVGQFTPKDYSLMLLMTKILGEKFFDTLRTKNQLGYVVQFSLAIFRDSYYICEKIQSSKPIDFVKNKIDEFNSQIDKIIKESKFEKFVETINKELDEPDYSLEDKISRYRPEISTRKYLFNRNQLIKEQINKLSKQDVLDFSQKIINESNKKVFVVSGNSQ
jgi:secreted Zn-dependent insulinase-like peptidase